MALSRSVGSLAASVGAKTVKGPRALGVSTSPAACNARARVVNCRGDRRIDDVPAWALAIRREGEGGQGLGAPAPKMRRDVRV